MPYKNDIEPISKQLTIVIGLTVVGFMAFGLALSYYRNILFEKTLVDFSTQNKQIADNIQQGYDDLEYYQSAQFKDKYAKENLNKYDPGEHVIVITPNPNLPVPNAQDNAAEAQQKNAAYQELLQTMPVIDQWNIFLFHRDSIDQLKEGLGTTNSL